MSDRAQPPPAWEVLLLRGPPRRRRVAARLVLEAADAAGALRTAKRRAQARVGGDALWSLGPLRPLTPAAPGTRRYRVRFAVWRERDEGYVRERAAEVEVRATDAASARRLAQQEVRAVPGYEPAWRIVRVTRVRRRAG